MMMILFWVDDYIICYKNVDAIDKITLILKDEFRLEKEDSMAGFLGLRIER